jgi:dimeric dUTPase (all-alpha-NTP-PPase superfamily)
MNLQKYFSHQRQLDDLIIREKHLTGRDLFSRKRLALMVEIAELANEFPETFKFWAYKKNQYDKALIELVDIFHFILSIGLDFGKISGQYIYQVSYMPINSHGHLKLEDVFKEFMVSASKLSTKTYVMFMNDFLALIDTLGFTWKEFEEAYFEKNQINHERQVTGY